MLRKAYKPYIILFLIIFWILVTARVAFSVGDIGIDPAAELSNLLGDPDAYVQSVEARPFEAIKQILAALTSLLGFRFLIYAIFPKS